MTGIKIEIELVKQDGSFSQIRSRITDARLDEGFLVNKIPTPCVKLLTPTGLDYQLLDIYNPGIVVAIIKRNIEKNKPLALSYRIFDPTILADTIANELMFPLLTRSSQILSICASVKKKDYLVALRRDKFDLKKLPPGAAHVLARSLPTPERPVGVSKFQYFNFLLRT